MELKFDFTKIEIHMSMYSTNYFLLFYYFKHTHIYVCVCVCVCIYIYIYIYVYFHILIHKTRLLRDADAYEKN